MMPAASVNMLLAGAVSAKESKSSQNRGLDTKRKLT